MKKKATRKELLDALKAVEQYISEGDVLFDPNPQWEEEQERYDKASEALYLVTNVLAREEG